MMNYHNRKFKVQTNSTNGEVDTSMIFHYQQEQNILTCSYSGGKIKMGHLIGTVDENGMINMCYHQINLENEVLSGKCISTPSISEDGILTLSEKWEWISGKTGSGSSILVEI